MSLYVNYQLLVSNKGFGVFFIFSFSFTLLELSFSSINVLSF